MISATIDTGCMSCSTCHVCSLPCTAAQGWCIFRKSIERLNRMRTLEKLQAVRSVCHVRSLACRQGRDLERADRSLYRLCPCLLRSVRHMYILLCRQAGQSHASALPVRQAGSSREVGCGTSHMRSSSRRLGRGVWLALHWHCSRRHLMGLMYVVAQPGLGCDRHFDSMFEKPGQACRWSIDDPAQGTSSAQLCRWQ